MMRVFKKEFVMMLFILITGLTGCDYTDYFQNSYDECRSNFRALSELAKEQLSCVEIRSIPVESRVDNDLTIDTCYIPAKINTKRLLIMASGVHGLEGFVGSAAQQMFMVEILPEMNLDDTGVLLIHGINPYGFKYGRRFSENNVDLNRNFHVDSNDFLIENPEYESIDDFLNPTTPVGFLTPEFIEFTIKSTTTMLENSSQFIKNASLKGQYHKKEGVYFGGYEYEPQVYSLTDLLSPIMEKYDIFYHIDLHTALGDKNKLHYLGASTYEDNNKELTEKVFEGYAIDARDSEDFYDFYGDTNGYVVSLANGKPAITMTYEYGTINTGTLIGGTRMIMNVILENQGYHYGYENPLDRTIVETAIREIFYPSNNDFKKAAIEQSRAAFRDTINNFQALTY